MEFVFSHWGLATTTVAHALLTLVTGLALAADRHGFPPLGNWRAACRVAHTAFGLLLVMYLLATYLVVPF